MIAIEYTGYLVFRDEFLTILDDRFYTPEWLDSQVWAGFYRCLSCEDAALLFEIKGYPTGLRELHFVAAAGELSSLIQDLRPKAEDYAREIGCRIVSVASRAGWARALKPHDYEVYQTVLRKEI